MKYCIPPFLFILLLMTSCSSAQTVKTTPIVPSIVVKSTTYPTFTPSASLPAPTITMTVTPTNPCDNFDVDSVNYQDNVRFQNGLLAEIGTQDNCNINGNAIAFSPDGSLLALANYDGVRLYNSQTGKLVHYLASRGVGKEIASVKFSPNGTLLASITVLGEVKLWNINSELEVNVFSHQSNSTVSWESWRAGIDFDKQGSLLIAWTLDDQLLRIWDVSTSNLIASVSVDGMNGATISPNGHSFVIGKGNGWEMYDVDSKQIVSKSSKKEGVDYFAFSDDGQRLYTTIHYVGDVSIWNPQTGKKLLSLGHCDSFCRAEGPMLAYARLDLTTDGTKVVFIDFFHSKVVLWNTQTGSIIDYFEIEGFIKAVAINADGTQVAALADSDGNGHDMLIYFWHITSK